jgi:hypothetical protein
MEHGAKKQKASTLNLYLFMAFARHSNGSVSP